MFGPMLVHVNTWKAEQDDSELGQTVWAAEQLQGLGHTPLILALNRQRQMDNSEFEATLIYIMNSRPVRYKDLVSTYPSKKKNL